MLIVVIKVANIIEEGRYGGPQTRILKVSERLKSDGIETIIICPVKDSERFYEEAIKRGIKIQRIPMCRLTRDLRSVLQFILTFPKEVYHLYSILKNMNIDIVHCNSTRQFKGVVASHLARKKVIWHLQDTWSPIAIRFIFYFIALSVNFFIASAERAKKYYLANRFLNFKKVRIIHPPVDTSFFDSKLDQPDKLISNGHKCSIVSVGNINPIKGFDFFIRAASYFYDKNDSIKFWIIGPVFDSQRHYYNKLCELMKALKIVNCHFYGPSENVRSILIASDIYVCSSLSETGPLTLWEAMSMGKAVVSTDVGDVRRFIQDGVNGFIVPPRDPKALADKIGVLINDSKLRESFGAKARSVAIRHLDISICVRKHAEVYREILRR